MIELIKIKSKDVKLLEIYCFFADIFIKEYYANFTSSFGVEIMLNFNNEEILSREIKEKLYHYYIIKCDCENIGIAEMHKQSDMLFISKIFVLKEYRNKGILKKLMENIKHIAFKEKLLKLKTSIPSKDIKAQEIFKKMGFEYFKEIGRYIGSNTFLYEKIFIANITLPCKTKSL